MTEQRTAYVTQPSPSVPRDLFNFWRRVLKLPRGRVYHLVLILPEQAERPIEWAFMGDGKRENEG